MLLINGCPWPWLAVRRRENRCGMIWVHHLRSAEKKGEYRFCFPLKSERVSCPPHHRFKEKDAFLLDFCLVINLTFRSLHLEKPLETPNISQINVYSQCFCFNYNSKHNEWEVICFIYSTQKCILPWNNQSLSQMGYSIKSFWSYIILLWTEALHFTPITNIA